MERKIVPLYEDYGFGFKVKILNAPMAKIRGEWILDLDQKLLQRTLLFALTQKPFRLTGAEIKFIRHYFELTTTEFGKLFDVSHVAVLKWEKRENLSTEMNWSTEKDIRLFILTRLESKPIDFLDSYKYLSQKALQPSTRKPIEIDAKKVA